jgi:hypothetical protein
MARPLRITYPVLFITSPQGAMKENKSLSAWPTRKSFFSIKKSSKQTQPVKSVDLTLLFFSRSLLSCANR